MGIQMGLSDQMRPTKRVFGSMLQAAESESEPRVVEAESDSPITRCRTSYSPGAGVGIEEVVDNNFGLFVCPVFVVPYVVEERFSAADLLCSASSSPGYMLPAGCQLLRAGSGYGNSSGTRGTTRGTFKVCGVFMCVHPCSHAFLYTEIPTLDAQITHA